MNDEGRLVRIDDTALWVVERGDAASYPVLVLHGGPGLDHHEFAGHLDPLTDHGCRLVFVDIRACGRSERPPERSWTLERHAQDVIMLARALRLHRYAVLGHSYGAMVALQNAVDYPGMAAQVIVSSGVASARWLHAVEPNLLSFEPVSLRRQVADSWAREPEVETQEEFATLMADQMPFHFADPTDPRIGEYLHSVDDMVYAPDVLRHVAADDAGGIEVEDRLDQVASPTLVLSGRHDRTCVPQAAEAMAGAIPEAELVIFESSGHMTFVEEEPAYVAAVAGFLDRHR